MKTFLRMKSCIFGLAVAILSMGVTPSRVAEAATIVSGVITVAPGDVSLDQDPSGYDYRWQYDTEVDEYYENGNAGTAEVSGWENAVVFSDRAARGTDASPSQWLARDANGGGPSTVYEWAFDFSGSGYTIDELKVKHDSIIFNEGAGNAVNKLEWEISTDGGANWTQYFELLGSDITGGNVFSKDVYHDLTSLVPAGTNAYRLRATMTYNFALNRVQILRTDGFFTEIPFDNQVWLTAIPEPSSLLLVGIGTLGLLTLSGRRKEREW